MGSSNLINKNRGSGAQGGGRKRRGRATALVGVAVSVAVFAWLGRGIVENWGDLSSHLAEASPWVIAGAVALFLSFASFISASYFHSLRLAGADVTAPAAMSVYLASQLGKYLPGKVLYVAGQIGLASWLRIPVTVSVVGFMASQIIITATGAMIAGPLLGIVVGKGTVIAVIVLAAVGFVVLASGVWVRPFNAMQRKRGKPALEGFSPARAVKALVTAGLAWVSYGCFAVILSTTMMPQWTPGELAHVGMAAVAAWLVGFLSFITPAGMGVREGTLVLLTRGILPEPTAMATALIMRLIHTLLQVLIGILTLNYSIRRRPAAD